MKNIFKFIAGDKAPADPPIIDVEHLLDDDDLIDRIDRPDTEDTELED